MTFQYFFRKTIRIFFVLLGATILTFLLTESIQGNPAEMAVTQSGSELTQESVAVMEKKLGLDLPVWIRYIDWIVNAVKGNFGNSYLTGEPVLLEIVTRMPATLKLTFLAFSLTFLVAIPVGILTAMKKGSLLDQIIQSMTFGFMGIPTFVWGLLLAYMISVRFKLLPMVGFESWKYRILPTVTLAIPMSCRYIRLIRANLLEVLDEEYIYLLRTKGFREWVILQKNAMKNAFLPVISILGLGFGHLLGGSVVVENIFSIPGLGSFLTVSINGRDYPVIQAYILLMAFTFVMINYMVDLVSGFLDPRTKCRGGKAL